MTVTLIDPTLGPAGARKLQATRPASLDGATIGLMNNGKTHGREILLRVAHNLRARYDIADVVLYSKSNASVPATAEELDDLASGSSVIIAAIGD